MTRCDRISAEGWLGDDDDSRAREHLEQCADCREAREAYRRIADGFVALGAEHELPGDAEARLWAAVATQRDRRRWRWPVWLGIVSAMVAAAAVLFLLLRSGGSERDPAAQRVLALAVLPPDGQAGDDPVRNGQPAVGDRLRITAPADDSADPAHFALRVYRNERELLVQCPGDPACVRHGSSLVVLLPIDALGVYTALWLDAGEPIAPSSSSLAQDLADAVSRGAEYQLREVEVR